MDEKWLPEVRQWMCESTSICLNHIKNGTFKEEDFAEYFIHWKQYNEVNDNYYKVHGEWPKYDYVDDSKLPEIAEYYNAHTTTGIRYDNIGRRSEGHSSNNTTSSSSSSSSSSEWHDDEWIKYLIYAGIGIVCYFLLRGCTRGQAEELSKKYMEANKDRIIWEDPNYVPNNIEEEVIRPGDYPVRTLK